MSKRQASSSIKQKQVTQAALMRKVQRDPCRFRVGATSDMSSRMSGYKSDGCKGKTAYYAPSQNPGMKEDKLLSKLPANHPHNDHKLSNYRGPCEGYVYAIDMKK